MRSEGTTTILETVGEYIKYAGQRKGYNPNETPKELQRFVSWCGASRSIKDIPPSVIGEYADRVAGTGTTPQASERLQEVRKFLSFVRNKGLGPEDKNGKQVNLAHHVRVRRTRVRQTRAAVQEEKLIELTAEGHEQLVNELENLKSQRSNLALEIQRAAADKDVRENAPLEAAREEAGRVESRIREIESTLGNAVVIDKNDPTRSQIVKLGTVVEVQDISSEREFKYTVVSASEANPLEFKISDASPLGKVLLGRAAGHEVVADTPRGNVTYKIISIS